MVWVDAIVKFHCQGHFEGQESDFWSIVEMVSIFYKTSTSVIELVNKNKLLLNSVFLVLENDLKNTKHQLVQLKIAQIFIVFLITL